PGGGVHACGYDLRAAVEEASRTVLARPELAGVEGIIAVHARAYCSRPGPRAPGAEAILAADPSAYCSRPGPRLVDGVEILAAALHPGRLPPSPAGTAVRLGPRPPPRKRGQGVRARR